MTQVIRRAADYGLGKPPREMLFTVLNPESKFKSKSLIDTVLQRGADAGGQWLYKLVEGVGRGGPVLAVRRAVRGVAGCDAHVGPRVRNAAARRR